MINTQIEAAVQFLKQRIKKDRSTFVGYSAEWNQIKELIAQTADHGESNSALIIGPIGCGKTTMMTSTLIELLASKEFRSNTLLVNLNGYIHTDDALALKSITRQMNLETVVEGKVFTTFADNLAFLLECLKSGDRMRSKSVVFTLEEFDLFCDHTNQTLIYNLFDVAQSAQAPICVIGVTRRYDVIELLEKRVKSRFSHRQIFLFNELKESDQLVRRFIDLFQIPETISFKDSNQQEMREYCKKSNFSLLRHSFDDSDYANVFKPDFIKKWNDDAEKLKSNKIFKNAIASVFDYSGTMSTLKTIAYRVLIVACIDESFDNKQSLFTAKFPHVVHRVIEEEYLQLDSKVELMCDLSILEISLVIAMKQHSEIYDNDPFNFEMILTRLHKFQNSGECAMGSYDRDVVLKAFDVLKYLGLIVPFGSSNKNQKEFQMYKMLVQNQQIDKAINLYRNLPTQISQWAKAVVV